MRDRHRGQIRPGDRGGGSARWQQMSLEEHMEHYESQGNSRKEAMKLVAKDRGVSKRDVYQALLEAEEA